IKAHSQHITAEEIHAAIVPQQPFIDIATVYRTLQWLQTVGLVAPISTGEGKLYYEYHAPGEHHHHLICQQCSQHIQIPDADLAGLKQDLLARYGFTLELDHLPLLRPRGRRVADDEGEWGSVLSALPRKVLRLRA